MTTATPPSASNIAYRQLLDTIASFVYTTDIDGRYTYANQLVLDLLGENLKLEDILGKSFTDFVDIGEDDSLRETDWRVIRNGETIAREEVNYIHATGETRTYWSIKKPLCDGGGHVIGLIGISHDITEKKRLEDKVRKQKELLDAVLNNIEAVVYMKDANRNFVYANQHLANLFGKSVEEIVGHRDSELMPQDVADAFWEKDIQILASGQRYAGEESLVDATGQTRHYWSVVVPWSGFDGVPASVGLITDITELHALKEELQHQALTDSLTGVANRRSFFERAEQEFARSRRHGHALSLVTLDIDHFKLINDQYGHPIGDSVLQHFSACCLKQLREGDFFARIGGEEFCVLLPETGLEEALEIAERIREVTSCHCLDTVHPSLQVSASFGVTSLNEMDAGFDTLFSRADRALYIAKEKGRDQTMFL